MPATLALSDEIVDYFPEREGILQCKRRGEIDPFLKIVPVETLCMEAHVNKVCWMFILGAVDRQTVISLSHLSESLGNEVLNEGQ